MISSGPNLWIASFSASTQQSFDLGLEPVANKVSFQRVRYDDPSVVAKVKDAALVVGDRNLLDAVESIEGREELLDTIQHGYGLGGVFRMVLQMDGSMMTRIPQRALSSVAA
ncbi:hypothetical protein FBT96_03970 [Rhodobacter capsulatus]|uniref:Uncharacterized protein n=2 Tax=Rhodobacter capsulatus TaxID=1061 RepID=A0A4U1JZZ5_RHOCA|nr:hypothetical protein FBT96_03970 [Rhodobacter capsulatus]